MERPGPSGINIHITITEGTSLIAQLDTLQLTPKSQITKAYDVPAAKLMIFADALPGAGNGGVDFLIYGSP